MSDSDARMASSAACPYCSKSVSMLGARLGFHRVYGGVCDGSDRAVARLDENGRAVLAQPHAPPHAGMRAFAAPLRFDAQPSPDGTVSAGKWDLVCIFGEDKKDGQSTAFTVETLSQMVANFEARGDEVAMDAQHLSSLVHVTGRPAVALAWYSALAVVANGSIVKLGCARGESVSPTYFSGDGLWAYRSSITPAGAALLADGQFKYLSPTFVSEGTARDGTPVGYCLLAIACTNSPWQSGTILNV